MQSVVIVGAGPAGSVAGTLLARLGWRVDLIEQHRFPRDKVCGECVSPLGVEVLKRVGVERALRRAGVVSLQRSAFVGVDGSETVASLPQEMWGISRVKLDSILRDVAKEAGAIVRQPARVEHVDLARQRVAVRNLERNETHDFAFEHLLVGDGKASVGIERPAMSNDLGVKAHFKGVRDHSRSISLFALPGHYCGLAPVEDGLWNVAMSVPVQRVRAAEGDLERIWEQVLSENEGLARRMRHAERVTNWLAAPLPRHPVRRNWPGNVIPIGNAAAALEPIGGEGMGVAMRSGELAAEALEVAARAEAPVDVPGLISQYRKLWRWRSLICRLGAMIAARPRLAQGVVAMLAADQRLAGAMFALTGKCA